MGIENIGENIEKLRRQKSLTQQELGYQIGLTASAISNIECNRSIPSIDTLCRFSEFFGVTVDALLSEAMGGHNFEQLVLEETLCTVDRYLSRISEVSAVCRIGSRQYQLNLKDGDIEYQAVSLNGKNCLK